MMRIIVWPIIFASAVCAADPPAVVPPPGWRDVTPSVHDASLMAALSGPQGSSFILTRLNPVNRANRAEVRAFLIDVMAGVNERTGLSFAPEGNMKTASFKNNLSADYLLLDLEGKPRMILALTDDGDTSMLATLTSSVPETLLDLFLSSLRPKLAPSPHAESSDGQLSVDLPKGLLPRPLDGREKARGFVLAASGPGGEIVFMRVEDASLARGDLSKSVAATVASTPGIEPASISAPGPAATKAGPSAILAAGAASERGKKTRVAGAFLPWAYWGYTVFAKGEQADSLLRSCLASTDLGPSAVPRLVASTPKVSLGAGDAKRYQLLFGALLASTALAALALRVRKR